MSLKIHFLHLHLDFSPSNLAAISGEHVRRFHQLISDNGKVLQGKVESLYAGILVGLDQRSSGYQL
jgi:hypothetical protein